MEYLKIWAFQNSTSIAVVESFASLIPHTIYGHLKEKGRAVMILPLIKNTDSDPAFLDNSKWWPGESTRTSASQLHGP
jgi:hypothetical protein